MSSSDSFSESPDAANDSDFSADRSNSPSVGDRVDVLWDEDNAVYPGTVHSESDDGRMDIHYDHGDIETADMTTVQWNHSNPLAGNSGNVTTDLQVISSEHAVLSAMLEHFGNKPFLKYRAQGFDQYPLVNSYTVEEETFLKTACSVYHRYVPQGANVINSHTTYKVKKNDDGTLKLKARIAPHGNEDNLKDILSKDCTTCPPTGLRVLESIVSLHRWKLYKADVTAAFLQTGAADRGVYVRPPTESRMRSSHMLLLLTAAYGLVNANAKWQSHSDSIMLELGLLQSKYIPQLFYKKQNGKLVLLISKIVEDLKVAGQGNNAQVFVEAFDQKFKFSTVSHGPGKMLFFGINTVQHEDSSIETDAEDNIEAVTQYPLLRQRRKESDSPLNAIEKSSFASANSSIGWIGTAASPLCSLYSSYLQQKLRIRRCITSLSKTLLYASSRNLVLPYHIQDLKISWSVS